jgi:prepilin-type N-terminal cleavage/methylation domain-containing protein
MLNKNSGFTLIELLVVIAIIGVLASIIGVGLNPTRTKGVDASIIANFQNAMEQAALYYVENGQRYTNICTATSGISAMVQAADDANGAPGIADCNGNDSAWAAAATLTTDTATYYCIDSVGSEKIVTGQITTTAGATNFHTTNTRQCP